jgi:hypothetical protein
LRTSKTSTLNAVKNKKENKKEKKEKKSRHPEKREKTKSQNQKNDLKSGRHCQSRQIQSSKPEKKTTIYDKGTLQPKKTAIIQ